MTKTTNYTVQIKDDKSGRWIDTMHVGVSLQDARRVVAASRKSWNGTVTTRIVTASGLIVE